MRNNKKRHRPIKAICHHSAAAGKNQTKLVRFSNSQNKETHLDASDYYRNEQALGNANQLATQRGRFESISNTIHSSMDTLSQYYSCFISYSSLDKIFAQQLYGDLQKNGVKCWFAPHDLKPGDYIRQQIDEAVQKYDKLLLILSEHSVASRWVKYEVELALSRENNYQHEILFPIRLDQAILHSGMGWASSLKATRHIGNFAGWEDESIYQQTLSILLSHLIRATKER